MTLRFVVFLTLFGFAVAVQAQAQAELEQLQSQLVPLAEKADLQPLVEAAGDRRLVLLGEASHGTSEFYTWRTHISQALIKNHDFRFIAVEGDWESSYRLNRYVRGLSDADHARDILEKFDRWPTWLWANDEVIQLIEWLKEHNRDLSPREQVGFYGIDLYGHAPLLQAIPDALVKADDAIGKEAAEHYACFEPYGDDMQAYMRASASGLASCASQAQNVVTLLHKNSNTLKESLGVGAYYYLVQSALVVKHAERHYSAMPQGDATGWNIRADFFYNTAERLLGFFGDNSKGIVWAHNTHIGDARATGMQQRGRHNIGQLARQNLGEDQVFAVGFATYKGMVVAASRWGAKRQVMPLPAAMEGSLEHLLHQLEVPRFLLMLDEDAPEVLQQTLGHRAIGVVYQPQMERFGNYVESRVDQRYDALIFLDETKPLALLDD